MPDCADGAEQQPQSPTTARSLHLIVSENKDGYPELLPSLSAALQKPVRRAQLALLVLSVAACIVQHTHTAMYRSESMSTIDLCGIVLQYALCVALMYIFLYAGHTKRRLSAESTKAAATAADADKHDDLLAITEYEYVNSLWARRFETAELASVLVLSARSIVAVFGIFSENSALKQIPQPTQFKHLLTDVVLLVMILIVRQSVIFYLQGIERRRYQQRQNTANSLLHSILVQLPGMVWWTVDTSTLQFSFLQATSVSAVLNRGPSDIIGRTILQLQEIHPDMPRHEIDHIISTYEEVMKTGRSYVFQYENPNGSGPRFNVLTPVLGGSNGQQVIRILGSSIDTSELQLAQKALRQSEKQYRLIMDTIQDHVLRVASDGQVLYSNHHFQSIAGSGASSTNDSFFSLFERNPLVLEQVKSQMDTLFALEPSSSSPTTHQGIKHIEFIVDSRSFSEDGVSCLYSEADLYQSFQHAHRNLFDAIMADELTFYSLNMNPIMSDDGSKVDSVIIVMVNQTERRKALEQQRRNESILVASSSKAEMLRILSHELRNPLQAILGSLELLDSMPNQSQLSPMQREFLSEAQANSRLLLDILNDFLDAEKIGSGMIDIVPSPQSLLSLLEGAVEMMSGAATRRGVELLFEFDERLPQQVMVDATRLNQIVLNLIGNACKFSRVQHESFVKLSARLLEEQGDSVSLLISCQDNGIGIPISDQYKIFQPFVQVAKIKNPTEFGGFGLGLPIVHNILGKMGGRIWLESTPGVGTTFFVQLSLTKITQEPVWSLLEPTQVSRILVVEEQGRARESASLGCLLQQLQQLRVDSSKIDIVSADFEIIQRTLEAQQSTVVVVDGHSPVLQQVMSLSVQVSVVVLHNGKIKDIPLASQSVSLHYLKKPIRLSKLHKLLREVGCTSEVSSIAPGAPAPSLRVDPQPPLQSRATLLKRTDQLLRFCIVDDSHINTRVVQQLLRKVGYSEEIASITTCSDGQEAVDLVRSSPHVFSCILMDLMMPNKDGWQASAEIRQISGYERDRVPIIALTGNQRDEQTQAKCNDAGMSDILTKPVSSAQLLAMLEKHLSASGSSLPGLNVA